MTDPPFVVRNPSCGKEDPAVEEALRILAPGSLVEGEGGEELRQAASRAIEKGATWLVAAGGDGTVQAVARGMGGAADATLGVLPLGTGNDFARALGMPLGTVEAARALVDGRERTVDLLEVSLDGGPAEIAVNAVTLGLSGPVHNALTPELKDRWGRLAYLRAAIEAAGEIDPFDARLELDSERRWTGQLLHIAFANGSTAAGGVPIAPHAVVDDGRIAVCGVAEGPWLELTAGLPDVLQGTEPDERWILSSTARVRLQMASARGVSVDGEPLEATSVEVRVLAGALRVRAP